MKFGHCNNLYFLHMTIADNMVDGLALLNLTHEDIVAMVPGKIGAARKLTVLLDKLKVSPVCSFLLIDVNHLTF